MAKHKKGYIEYKWQNPGDPEPRLKALYMSFFSPWQWIINAAPYKEEFYSLLDLEKFRQHLSRTEISKGNDRYAFVMDTQGDLIYHPTLAGQSALPLQDAKTGEYFVKQILAQVKQQGQTKGWLNYSFSKKGKPGQPAVAKMLYYQYFPQKSWIVGTIVNQQALLMPYHNLLKKLIIIASIAFAGLMVIGLIFSRYLIKRLSHLRTASFELLNHRYDIGLKRKSNDEIGDLEAAFATTGQHLSRAMDQLQRLNLTLEKKVQERTEQLAAKNTELEQLYVTDRLTGLCNRHKIDEALQKNLANAERYKRPFGVVMLDIDFFKKINDRQGHAIGDKILKEFALVLFRHTRKNDIVGRWGGEEFLVICPETDLNGLIALAEKLRVAIEQNSFEGGNSVTVSCGVAQFVAQDAVETLIDKADQALYQAKNTGRNQVCYYDQ
jgi:diguanylate cyclase (GGDEF)-like protein